jgi:hypothetical protein
MTVLFLIPMAIFSGRRQHESFAELAAMGSIGARQGNDQRNIEAAGKGWIGRERNRRDDRQNQPAQGIVFLPCIRGLISTSSFFPTPGRLCAGGVPGACGG